MIEKASFKVTVLGAVDGGEGVQLHHLQLLLTLAKHLLVTATFKSNLSSLHPKLQPGTEVNVRKVHWTPVLVNTLTADGQK